MPTRLVSVVFDAADPPHLARFWSEALGWPVTHEDDEESDVAPPEDHHDRGPRVELVFVPVTDPKTEKNRVHLDLASATAEEQRATVERLVGLGARPTDIGQGEVPWVVLADPEGNELCVLEPRRTYAGSGPIAAIVLDAVDPVALGPFWSEAAGWPIVESGPDGVALQSSAGRGPTLELLLVPRAKAAKLRVHLDVAPYPGDDHAAEVARLVALGASPADVGQRGDETWTVLADPEGNECCVLSPR